MLFTNQRSISKPTVQPTSTMSFMPTSRLAFSREGPSQYILNSHPPQSHPPQPPARQTAQRLRQATQTAGATLIRDKSSEPVKKSMKWGEPTWYLFHTLAEKVKEENFAQIRKELLDVIYTICVNLPCPTCAVHAAQYMNGINFNTIQTKQQLKDMLFAFHNKVNERKQYQLFDYIQLDEKYAAANTVAVIQNFMVHFQDKHSSIHMIANDMHRGRIAKILKQWFNGNIQYFNP